MTAARTVPNFAEIIIDPAKCTTPFDCKRCLRGCPQAVFMCFPVKVEKGKETDPREPSAYGIVPMFRDKCTGCRLCIDLCPVEAITISFPNA